MDDAADNPTFNAELDNPQSLNKYQYTFGNPLRYVDPDGHGIWVVVATIVEVAATVVDVVSTVRTVRDPNASAAEKVSSVVGTAVGMAAPEGGYGIAAKAITRRIVKREGTALVKTADNVKKPNPYGSPGKPDHQEEVQRQIDKAQAEAKPGETVRSNKKIR